VQVQAHTAASGSSDAADAKVEALSSSAADEDSNNGAHSWVAATEKENSLLSETLVPISNEQQAPHDTQDADSGDAEEEDEKKERPFLLSVINKLFSYVASFFTA
jgi:hypothetical protein